MQVARRHHYRGRTLRSATASQLAQRRPREALLEHLNHNAWIGSFRLAKQQMNMLGHHHVTGNYEAIALSHLFQNPKEQVTPWLRLKKGKSVITTKSDEVQKSVAVAAIEPGHR